MVCRLNSRSRSAFTLAAIGGEPFDSGSQYIQLLNQAFGYLVTQDIAPVWIGEIGASMNSQDDQGWAATVAPYLNGKTQGGLVVPAGGQPPGIDWWVWDCDPGGSPVGALQSDLTTVWPNQAAVFSQFVQAPVAGEAPVSTAAYARSVAAVAAGAFPAPASATAGSSSSTATSQTGQAAPVGASSTEQAAAASGQADAAQVMQSGSQAVARQAQALQGTAGGATPDPLATPQFWSGDPELQAAEQQLCAQQSSVPAGLLLLQYCQAAK